MLKIKDSLRLYKETYEKIDSHGKPIARAIMIKKAYEQVNNEEIFDEIIADYIVKKNNDINNINNEIPTPLITQFTTEERDNFILKYL